MGYYPFSHLYLLSGHKVYSHVAAKNDVFWSLYMLKFLMLTYFNIEKMPSYCQAMMHRTYSVLKNRKRMTQLKSCCSFKSISCANMHVTFLHSLNEKYAYTSFTFYSSLMKRFYEEKILSFKSCALQSSFVVT